MATDYWGWKRKIKHLVKYLVPTMHWKGKFPTGEVQRKMKLSQVFSKQPCLENIFPTHLAQENIFPTHLAQENNYVVWCGVATMFRKFCLSVFSCGLFNFEKEISGFSSRCVSRLKKNLHKNGFFASLCVSQCYKTFFIHESKGGFGRVWFEQCSNLEIFAFFLCLKKKQYSNWEFSDGSKS